MGTTLSCARKARIQVWYIHATRSTFRMARSKNCPAIPSRSRRLVREATRLLSKNGKDLKRRARRTKQRKTVSRKGSVNERHHDWAGRCQAGEEFHCF